MRIPFFFFYCNTSGIKWLSELLQLLSKISNNHLFFKKTCPKNEKMLYWFHQVVTKVKNGKN
ncbi:hypothetical protein SGODD07_02113 [Streptococcus gordonii]|uniref:Uncharacterized protein n=1 Tax=Streptococcus gordonii TaxID=1302 RepID=A0A139MXI9_STRGN|nr:hypothetical protein SGODD07_02113 [Streptococcus gordonii]